MTATYIAELEADLNAGINAANDLSDLYLALAGSVANELADEYQALVLNLMRIGEPVPAAIATPVTQPKPEGPGIFKVGQIVYKVQVSRTSGKLYAKAFDGTTFVYESGAIFRIYETDRLTYEQAVAFGHETGICAMCSLELTDPESVEAGIGPVCEARWYGKGHRTARRQAKKAAAQATAIAELPAPLSPDEFANLFA